MGRLQPTTLPSDDCIKEIHPCDSCGYSKTDKTAITEAVYSVHMATGTLYFCDHHFKQHSGHIFAMGYDITKLE